MSESIGFHFEHASDDPASSGERVNNKARRLPGGSYTNSGDKYVVEWRRFGECVCEALRLHGDEGEFEVSAMDPGIRVWSKSNRNFSRSYDTWDAMLLARIGGWKP